MPIRCFLDTSYLMPFFGLEVTIDGLTAQLLEVQEDDRFRFLYSPVSFIEIKWQVIGLGRVGHDIDDLERHFSQAIISLKSSSNWGMIDFVDADINDVAFELRRLGHNDYFDTVIASTALWNADLFVTEDEPLKKVIHAYFEKKGDASDVKSIPLHDWKTFFTQYIDGGLTNGS
nr:hypothetical protein [Candidatus Sigynarchaeota archaeon]